MYDAVDDRKDYDGVNGKQRTDGEGGVLGKEPWSPAKLIETTLALQS